MTSLLNDTHVALVRETPAYARTAPYPASERYPEWPGAAVGVEDNPAFRAVRAALSALRLDEGAFGSPAWNPLGDLIEPGNTVILKPNLVSHRNLGERMYGETDTDSLVTHGSVIRAVLDYVAKALNGAGRIIVGDCPVQGTDWDQVTALVGLDAVSKDFATRFPGVELALIDYRLGKAERWGNTVVKRVVDDAALANYREVDLGTNSLLMPLMAGNYEFGVSDYPRHRMRAAHTPQTNTYLYPHEILNADVVINLPKMKVHMKAGITCALKNFVGTIGHKDYLPHFRFGSPSSGGDEYPELGAAWAMLWGLMHRAWDYEGGKLKVGYIAGARVLAKLLTVSPRIPQPVWALGGGSWHGNDTLWRTVLDIHRAFLYYDPTANTNVPGDEIYTGRQYLAILDGLIGGERESPLSPSPRTAGALLAARNPLALDTVAAAVMGIDYRKVPQLAQGWLPGALPIASFLPDAIRIVGCPDIESLEALETIGFGCSFMPSRGYKGHIELAGKTEAAA